MFDTGIIEPVYNLRVADWHTYFVGDESWGWNVWAHNLCKYNTIYDALNPSRISQVAATVTRHSLKTGTATTASIRSFVKKIGQLGDDASHIIGRLLGGPGHLKNNIIPQLSKINRGQYRMFEKQIEKAVRKNGPASVTVELVYANDKALRPIEVVYTATFAKGKPLSKVFQNT